MPDAVETMVSGSNVIPWHRHGKVVAGQLTAVAALQEGGLDWGVSKVPLYAQLPDGGEVEVPDKFGIMRDTDNRVLGVVGKQYRPLQNKEAFSFADNLVDDGGAKYETAGSLKGGKAVWMMMRFPEGVKIDAEGEETDLFLAIRNSHDGTSSITAMVTPVRIVCQNTLNLALGTAKRMWSVRHVGTMDSKLQAARDALGLTFEYTDALSVAANELLAQKVSDRAFETLVGQLTDVEKISEGIISTYNNSPNLGNIRGTAWGAVNAVGEYFEHGRNHRSDEARLLSTFDGDARKARDKAVALLTA